MPNIVERTYWDGQALLQQAGVYNPKSLGYFGTFPIYAAWLKSDSPPGTILAQSVQPGTVVKPNSQVVLTLSEFPISVSFPTLPTVPAQTAPAIPGGLTTDTGAQLTKDTGEPLTKDSPGGATTWSAGGTAPAGGSQEAGQ